MWKKAEKIQQTCEELKDGGTKAMKERMEKKGRNEMCSKSQTLAFDSHTQTCMPTQTKARTNKTKTVIEVVACARTIKTKKQ